MASRCIRLVLAVLVLVACASAQRRAQAGPWTKSKIPEGWVVHKTKNYEIQSQAGIEKAKRLGKHMEAMNLVYRNLFRPDKKGSKKQVIKLLKDRKAYMRYGGPPGSGAYYARAHREMVCYDTGKWSDEDKSRAAVTGTGEKSAAQKRINRMRDIMKMDILGAAAHEGWHQYFSWLVVSYVEIPSWINEGMGDYFYTAVPNEKVTRRNPAKLGGMNGTRLPVVQAAIRQGRYVPIPELLFYSKAQYYSNPSVCYAEGWALCQFLLHSGNKRYAKVIPDFIKLVSGDTNMDDVTKKAFKGIDLEQLDKEFLAYVATMKLPGQKEEKKDDGGDPGQ